MSRFARKLLNLRWLSMLIDNKARVEHMLAAARKAVSYTQRHTRDKLDENEPLAVTIIHFCALVGEAAKKVDTAESASTMEGSGRSPQ